MVAFEGQGGYIQKGDRVEYDGGVKYEGRIAVCGKSAVNVWFRTQCLGKSRVCEGLQCTRVVSGTGQKKTVLGRIRRKRGTTDERKWNDLVLKIAKPLHPWYP